MRGRQKDFQEKILRACKEKTGVHLLWRRKKKNRVSLEFRATEMGACRKEKGEKFERGDGEKNSRPKAGPEEILSTGGGSMGKTTTNQGKRVNGLKSGTCRQAYSLRRDEENEGAIVTGEEKDEAPRRQEKSKKRPRGRKSSCKAARRGERTRLASPFKGDGRS